MEVGIEDCLHIEFEYNKSKYVPVNYTSSELNTCDISVPYKFYYFTLVPFYHIRSIKRRSKI